MRIAEIFHSLQGEGKLAGIPSTFIRISGCNLRCTWCDTPYASWNPEGPELSLDQILAQIPPSATHIVLTGGEPMMFKELVPLIAALKAQGKHITVETAGTLWLDNLPPAPHSIDLASISPKLSNSTPLTRESGRFAQSHEKQRLNFNVLKTFATHDAIVERQWKFVVASEPDLAEVETLLATLNQTLPRPIPPGDVLLMPEGIDAQTILARSQWLASICEQKCYRLSPRLHILLYGNTRGT
ncbi:MAG TPA: 7-carboxy-7-deazaguanine synthase QueE [Phycisphaerae bacterium]|jgi:7-carboxy-7-deazaguanine synthase